MNNQLTLANLSLLNSTKAERKAFVEEVMTQLEEGNYNPLQFHANIKNMEGILKAFTDKKESPAIAERYSKLLLDEAEKHGKKFEMYNAAFQVKEAGTKYNYEQCNDPVIASLHAQLAELTEKVKQREKFLQALPDGGEVVTDKETGETNTIYKPSKSSTTTVSVTIK